MFRKLLEKFKKKPAPAPPGTEDILVLARDVEGLLDGLVNRIFSQWGDLLLTQDITWVVPAIWGAVKHGELTRDQERIYEAASPVLKEATMHLGLKGLSSSQNFAVQYLLRSLVIAKIIYMIEATRRHRAEDQRRIESHNPLQDVEPWGHA